MIRIVLSALILLGLAALCCVQRPIDYRMAGLSALAALAVWKLLGPPNRGDDLLPVAQGKSPEQG